MRDLVGDMGIAGEGDEAVREALGDVEHVAILLREVKALPTPVGRRSAAEVDDHVVDGALHAAHHLHLAMRRALEMHAPERPASRVRGMVGLYEDGREAGRSELIGAEGAREEAALIAALLQRDKNRVVQGRLVEVHSLLLASSRHEGLALCVILGHHGSAYRGRKRKGHAAH